MGLAEAIADVIDILRGRPAGGGPDDRERMIAIIAENDGLPNREVERIEEAIDEAYRGWSDAQRRAIWCETESGGEEASPEKEGDQVAEPEEAR